MQIPTPNPIVVRQAKGSLRAKIHTIIVAQMADELIAGACDLRSVAAVKGQLLRIGFGSDSVNALAKRARRLALERGAVQ